MEGKRREFVTTDRQSTGAGGDRLLDIERSDRYCATDKRAQGQIIVVGNLR